VRSSLALVFAFALALGGSVVGCFGPATSPVKVVPYAKLNDAQPGRGTEFAFYVASTLAFKQTLPVRIADKPQNWTFESETKDITVLGSRSTSLLVRITPDRNATFGPHAVGILVGDTRADVVVNVKDLGKEPLRAGVGAQVGYVLWYDNGTLVETNEKVVADQAGLAWARLDNSTPDYTPLKIYVGGHRGTAPPEPYNSSGCDTAPCYHPVISGFDRRLRDAGDGSGMVAGETLAVRVNASDAYTYPGNEKHPLYGQNLNFLIRVVSVDVLTARSCTLPVCPPG
jgi:hypothetical protein